MSGISPQKNTADDVILAIIRFISVYIFVVSINELKVSNGRFFSI